MLKNLLNMASYGVTSIYSHSAGFALCACRRYMTQKLFSHPAPFVTETVMQGVAVKLSMLGMLAK